MASSKRKRRRERGRAKAEAAFKEQYAGYHIVKGISRLSTAVRDLKNTQDFLTHFQVSTSECTRPILLDLSRAAHIDAGACVLLSAAIQRCKITRDVSIEVRMPRNGHARFALAAFGVADDSRVDRHILERVQKQVMTVTSGMKGDPSPGERTFEVAKLAEGLVADEKLADRVHAALNEATDNVLSWAYGPADSPPNPAERWWVAGLLTNQSATFIALDHGAGIPSTAPQNFGDALTGFIKSMMQEKDWRPLNIKPTDSQILLATIRQRRTVSGLDERGKGLNNMIALIDLFSAGFINIFSGNALYGYCNPAPRGGDKEHCAPLGFEFPGTLVIWQLKAQGSEA